VDSSLLAASLLGSGHRLRKRLPQWRRDGQINDHSRLAVQLEREIIEQMEEMDETDVSEDLLGDCVADAYENIGIRHGMTFPEIIALVRGGP
jgi:hypothetical protein